MAETGHRYGMRRAKLGSKIQVFNVRMSLHFLQQATLACFFRIKLIWQSSYEHKHVEERT